MTTNQKITVFGIITLIGLFFIYNFYFSPTAICINEQKKLAQKQWGVSKPDDEWMEAYMQRAKLKCTIPQ